MVKLSININKVALLRNSRGENYPNVIEFAERCLQLGADGITVHPRPDERHIKYADVYELRDLIYQYPNKELNVEGFPSPDFLKMIKEVRPHQVTFVPDAPNVLTSNTGWDIRKNYSFLAEVLYQLNPFHDIRISLFVNADVDIVKYAKNLCPLDNPNKSVFERYFALKELNVDTKSLKIPRKVDRIELYTGPYAKYYPYNPYMSIQPYIEAARVAEALGIEVNAGHDLNAHNLAFFVQNIPNLKEVSIGHAIIADCLYYGIEETLKKYIHCLKTT